MEQFYYPKTIRGITVALLDMFNNIQIKKYDKAGTVLKTINVPITFAPHEKYQQIIKERENNQKYYLTIPRLALVLNGITYSSERAVGANETRHWLNSTVGLDNSDTFWEDYQPTPYDFNYTLFVRTDSLTDFSQIMENILPYFNPSLYLRLKEFSFLNIERDLQVTLESVNPDFTPEQSDDITRMVNADISLIVKGFMYRPISSKKIIKVIQSQYFIYEGDIEDTVLSDYFNTSGAEALSAAPDSALYQTSGTREDGIFHFTSGASEF